MSFVGYQCGRVSDASSGLLLSPPLSKVGLWVSRILNTGGNPKVQAPRSWYVETPRSPISKSSTPPLAAPQLVKKDTGETAAQSHSRIRSSIFKKPRDMSLEISQALSHAVDVVLLTFILVWTERHNERAKNSVELGYNFANPAAMLPLED